MTDQQADFVQLQSDFSQAIDASILDLDFTDIDLTIPIFDFGNIPNVDLTIPIFDFGSIPDVDLTIPDFDW